jgi:hypothetical protein
MSISWLSAENVCLDANPEFLSAALAASGYRLVHFAGFVLVEQGGRQLRRFRIDAVTQ